MLYHQLNDTTADYGESRPQVVVAPSHAVLNTMVAAVAANAGINFLPPEVLAQILEAVVCRVPSFIPALTFSSSNYVIADLATVSRHWRAVAYAFPTVSCLAYTYLCT